VPHIIVEYSENLGQNVKIADLLQAVHAAALATGLAPLDALRTRGEPRANYVIADGHPDNAFVSIVARLGPGRTPDEKHGLLNALVEASNAAIGDAISNVMLSVEYQEIDATFRINQNELRKTMQQRSAAPS
jgi:5-carboxymethyl-2-hydroxymuconate isomerase